MIFEKKIRVLILVSMIISLFACQMQGNQNEIDPDVTEAQASVEAELASARAIQNSSHDYWQEMAPVRKDIDNYYTLDEVTVTLYKTFHTGFESLSADDEDDAMMIAQSDKNNIVTLRNEDASSYLKFPDTGANVEVKKWVFWKCHLEGSAFITNPSTGKRYIINLRLPDPQMHEADMPYEAEVSRAGFRIVDYVDWGFDADPAHGGGLVPWRTVAINLSHYKIPANSWIYIPCMDGKWVPLPRLDDLGNSSGIHLPNPSNKANDPHFDWVQHDGFFRTTDISWSLPTWMGPNAIVDGKWIDMYVGSHGVMQWIWDTYWQTPFFDRIAPESETGYKWGVYRANMRVYETVSIPAFLEDGKIPQYRYTENINSDPFLNTKYYNIPAFGSQLSNAYKSLEFGNTYDFNNIENDELLAIKNNKVVKWEEKWGWASQTRDAKDVVIANLDGDEKDENVYLYTEGNNTYLSYGWNYGNLKTVKIDLPWFKPTPSYSRPYKGESIAAGDVDGDGKDEIVLLVRRPYGPGLADIQIFDIDNGNLSKKSWTYSGGAYRTGHLSCGDLDGDGKDEIFYSIGYKQPGIFSWNPRTDSVYRVVNGNVKAFAAMRLDSDHKDDFLVSFVYNKDGIYRWLSSHNKPTTEPRLIDPSRTPKYISEYSFRAPHN